MITIFFTAHQLILSDVLPKGSKFNEQRFINSVFPDLKMKDRNFHRRMPLATFWLHMDNSMGHNASKVVSKFDKHYIARLPHPPYSRHLSPCDYRMKGGSAVDSEITNEGGQHPDLDLEKEMNPGCHMPTLSTG
jgi:hypothetical protein